MGSIGESVSGIVVYAQAEQISADDAEMLDALAYKIENSLLRLTEALEQKKVRAEWSDQTVVRETNEVYEASESGVPVPQIPTTSLPHEGFVYESDDKRNN